MKADDYTGNSLDLPFCRINLNYRLKVKILPNDVFGIDKTVKAYNKSKIQINHF
jgi:hypothetical protein